MESSRQNAMSTATLVRLAILALTLGAIAFSALRSPGDGPATTVRAAGSAGGEVAARVAAQTATQSDAQSDEARSGSGAQDADGNVTMTLLHNNDGESKLLPNLEGGFPGIARFAAAWVELGRSTDADILLRVSAGDNFLASKEFAASLAREDEPYYDSIALRGLYEVMALGNHDFDFGPDVTARFIEGFRLNAASEPVMFVAANLDVSDEPALQALSDEGRLVRSTIVTDASSELEVGVIGAITPQLANISSPRNATVDADVATAVNNEVETLREQGVERIVLVSHLQGLGQDRDLVPQLSGVDIVVAGGGDELLRNDGDTCLPDESAVGDYPELATDLDGIEVPIVTAPGGYRCIGRLDVTFDADGVVTQVEGSSIGVDLDGDAEEFAMSRVEEPLAEALAELDATVIGESDVVLDGRRTSVRTGPSNVGELLADALLAAGGADAAFGGQEAIVAVQNGGGIRNDAEIPAGEITEADTFDIAPFANYVVVGDVPRERFKEMLEAAVAGLPEAEGTFPQIAGFTLEVDASQPARELDRDGDCSVVGDEGSRVRSVTLADGTEIVVDGEVVDGDDLTMATIDFLAGGGDCYPLGDLDFTALGASYQQALSGFITDDLNGTISADDYPEGGSRITIENLDAASAQDEDDEDTSDDDEDTSDDDTSNEDDDDYTPDDPTVPDDAAAEDDDESNDDTSASDDGESTDETADQDLPNTGQDAWLLMIIATTAAAAGALVFFEARRAGWLSLTNRLSATRAWIPDDATDRTDG